MRSLGQVLTGALVVATCPIWWALLAVAIVAWLIWETLRVFGEGAWSLIGAIK